MKIRKLRNLGGWVILLCQVASPGMADDSAVPSANLLPPLESSAQPAAPSATRADGAARAEEADVEAIRQKYWAMGNRFEMGVVQARRYPKRKHVELTVGAGILAGDPFLSTRTVGGSVGYHFSELLSVHLTGWNASATSSSALTTLETETGHTANTNAPKNYVGAEARASVLYGKLSLLNAQILYLDTYFSGGGGRISTQSGTNVLLQAGIGEQIRLSKMFSLNLDFQLLWYRETVLAQYSKGPVTVGQNLGTRSTLSSLVTLSMSCFL